MKHTLSDDQPTFEQHVRDAAIIDPHPNLSLEEQGWAMLADIGQRSIKRERDLGLARPSEKGSTRPALS